MYPRNISEQSTNTYTHIHTCTSTVYTTKQSQRSDSSLQSPSSSPLLTALLLFLLFPLSVSFSPSVSVEAVTAQSGSQRSTGGPTLCLPSPPFRSKSPFFLSSLFLSLPLVCICLSDKTKEVRLGCHSALCCAVRHPLSSSLSSLLLTPCLLSLMTSSCAD